MYMGGGGGDRNENPLSFQQNPPKSLDQKLTPKKSHADLPSLENFQKGLNNRFYETDAM